MNVVASSGAQGNFIHQITEIFFFLSKQKEKLQPASTSQYFEFWSDVRYFSMLVNLDGEG